MLAEALGNSLDFFQALPNEEAPEQSDVLGQRDVGGDIEDSTVWAVESEFNHEYAGPFSTCARRQAGRPQHHEWNLRGSSASLSGLRNGAQQTIQLTAYPYQPINRTTALPDRPLADFWRPAAIASGSYRGASLRRMAALA